MLHLLLGGNLEDRKKKYGEKYIGLTQHYFDAVYEGEWMLKPFTKRLVKGVDNCEVMGEHAVLCPIFGSKAVTTMSTGTKTVILLDNEDIVVSGERIGDNCWKYVFELAEEKDIYICLNHTVHPKWWPEWIKFYRENDDIVWEGTYKEFLFMSCHIFDATRRLEYTLIRRSYESYYVSG